MRTILHLDCSPRVVGSVTRELSSLAVTRVQAVRKPCQLVYRDLGAGPPPAVTAAQAEAFFVPEHERSEAQAASLALSDVLVDELLAADILVVGMPMYNFTVPASFKAWIDLIVRPHRTFRRTGPGQFEGLCPGKQAIICTACSGAWLGGASDHLRPYLRTVLALMGIKDVAFVDAEKLARGDEARAASLDAARARIEAVAGALGA